MSPAGATRRPSPQGYFREKIKKLVITAHSHSVRVGQGARLQGHTPANRNTQAFSTREAQETQRLERRQKGDVAKHNSPRLMPPLGRPHPRAGAKLRVAPAATQSQRRSCNRAARAQHTSLPTSARTHWVRKGGRGPWRAAIARGQVGGSWRQITHAQPHDACQGAGAGVPDGRRARGDHGGQGMGSDIMLRARRGRKGQRRLRGEGGTVQRTDTSLLTSRRFGMGSRAFAFCALAALLALASSSLVVTGPLDDAKCTVEDVTIVRSLPRAPPARHATRPRGSCGDGRPCVCPRRPTPLNFVSLLRN